MEEYSLQIKTNTNTNTQEQIKVFFYKAESSLIGYMIININTDNPSTYFVDQCTNNLDITLPSERNKVWTITITEDALLIKCNSLEIATVLFASSDDCSGIWNARPNGVLFVYADETSDEYRQFNPDMYPDAGKTIYYFKLPPISQ